MRVLLDHILGKEVCQVMVELLKTHVVAALQDFEDMLIPVMKGELDKIDDLTDLLDIVKSMNAIPWWLRPILWTVNHLPNCVAANGVVMWQVLGQIQVQIDELQIKAEVYEYRSGNVRPTDSIVVLETKKLLKRAAKRYKNMLSEQQKNESKHKLIDLGIYDDEINIFGNKDDIEQLGTIEKILQDDNYSNCTYYIGDKGIGTRRSELIPLLTAQLGNPEVSEDDRKELAQILVKNCTMYELNPQLAPKIRSPTPQGSTPRLPTIRRQSPNDSQTTQRRRLTAANHRFLSAAEILGEGSQRVPRGLAQLMDDIEKAEEAH